MKLNTIYNETTILTKKKHFLMFYRFKYLFEFPLYNHSEYEINFIENEKSFVALLAIKKINNCFLVFCCLSFNALLGNS